jgi:hypothetical protein
MREDAECRASSASNMQEHNEELTLQEATRAGLSVAAKTHEHGHDEHHAADRADQNHRPIGHDGPLYGSRYLGNAAQIDAGGLGSRYSTWCPAALAAATRKGDTVVCGGILTRDAEEFLALAAAVGIRTTHTYPLAEANRGSPTSVAARCKGPPCWCRDQSAIAIAREGGSGTGARNQSPP